MLDHRPLVNPAQRQVEITHEHEVADRHRFAEPQVTVGISFLRP
jgi:hypothetical protein